jgi:hypothetical protein
VALVEYLQKFKDQEGFHGIVFVRRRQVRPVTGAGCVLREVEGMPLYVLLGMGIT